MKKRFIILNLLVVVILISISLAYQNYLKLVSRSMGEEAQLQLSNEEEALINDLASLSLSIYSTNNSELNQVRNDIMGQFSEEDFQSITIQPQASFIDTLLFDSKLKEFMDNSNLNKSNKSLLKKMKLYLPNELLVSLLPDIGAIEQIIAIEEYLQENSYIFLNSNEIPSVKSNIKHYYFDKSKFKEIMDQFSLIVSQRATLQKQLHRQYYFEGFLVAFLLLFVPVLIQLIDYYLRLHNQEKIKFLLKGHIHPRKYYKGLWFKKSLSMIIILIGLIASLIIDFNGLFNINIDTRPLVFNILLIAINLVIFISKKERIII